MNSRVLTICIFLFALLTLHFDGEKDFTPPHRTFQFTYTVTLPHIPGDAEEVEVFVPIPRDTKYQKINEIEIQTDHDYSFQTDPDFNNKILHLVLADEIPGSLHFSVRVEATRYAITAGDDYSQTATDLQRYLRADSLVPVDAAVEEEAFSVMNTQMSPMEKTRAFYDHLVETMEYDKSGEGWGRGDALYACTKRKGNCTDFHSLFIGMSRAAKIPARFKIGFPLPPKEKEGEIGGYHCWAEFYISERGWIPVDASEGHKHPERGEFFYGNLDAHRIQFTTGRDIQVTTNEERTRTLNFLIYPYVLVDNRTFRGEVATEFSFKDLE